MKNSYGENLNKYLNVARELEKLCNMRLTVIEIIVANLGNVFKGLEKYFGS